MTATIIILSVLLAGILVMSKIKSIKIEDKTYHVWADAFIPMIGGLSFYHWVYDDFWISILVGALLGTFAAFFKEFIIDKLLGLGQFEWADIKYSMWGTAIGTVGLIMLLASLLHLGDTKINP